MNQNNAHRSRPEAGPLLLPSQNEYNSPSGSAGLRTQNGLHLQDQRSLRTSEGKWLKTTS